VYSEEIAFPLANSSLVHGVLEPEKFNFRARIFFFLDEKEAKKQVVGNQAYKKLRWIEIH